MEFSGFNDYEVEVLINDEIAGVFHYASNIRLLTVWLNMYPKYAGWTSIRVYHRLTHTLLGTYQRHGEIPAWPGAGA